ncbi:histidine triad nucleotide binding protein, putative, partial [Perkinsus marinus ATCC 50983]
NLKELNFKVGIHAVPSLEPFHVHVISSDMRSSRIKHKKHWNSFNTPFFVELSEAEEILQRDGNLHSISSRETHLRDDLLCNVCGHNFGGHFTKLIRHVMVCSQHPATKRSAAVDDYSENETKSRRLES